jgi:hypothetical protein
VIIFLLTPEGSPTVVFFLTRRVCLSFQQVLQHDRLAPGLDGGAQVPPARHQPPAAELLHQRKPHMQIPAHICSHVRSITTRVSEPCHGHVSHVSRVLQAPTLSQFAAVEAFDCKEELQVCLMTLQLLYNWSSLMPGSISSSTGADITGLASLL